MPASSDQRHVRLVGIAPFALSIFASALLVFQVQPMVGKRILPWFGGAPGVWILCLAFYQTSLFLGYAYAHLLIRRIEPARQPVVHALLLLASLAVLPVLPGASWKPDGIESPSVRILGMLAANVGLPFLWLAATGPLLQSWFARAFPARSPYPLYAVSKLLPLSVQSRLWSWSFGACGLAILYCAWRATRGVGQPSDAAGSVGSHTPLAGAGRGDALLWAALPCCAVILLMGVTNELCLNIASVPFLWIIPLSVYLLTFILCFSSARFYRRGAFAVLAAVSLLLLLQAQRWTLTPDSNTLSELSIAWQIARYAFLLFACCMLVHGELYRLRPHVQNLTAYYLCIAGGGALGGLFVGIAAPGLFSDYYELGIGIIACWVLLLVSAWRDPRSGLSGGRPRPAWALIGVVGVAVVAGSSVREKHPDSDVLLQQRNFFGVLRVLKRGLDQPGRHYHVLNSGTTTHGAQDQHATLRSKPTTYYGHVTGVGFAMRHRRAGEHPRVGIIGLGVGTLSAYGREGDLFRYYEIDPDVVRIARDEQYFSFLGDSRAASEVVVGDARLSLESQLRDDASQAFDFLVIDAFTSDAIPVHLLTAEAFDLYDQHLKEDGVILTHVSNRHLDLSPLLFGHAVRFGMRSVGIANSAVHAQRSASSRWVIFSRDAAYIDDLVAFVRAQHEALRLPRGALRMKRPNEQDFRGYPVWTDDYSNLFGLLKPKRSSPGGAPVP
jgi:spermidine synthase